MALSLFLGFPSDTLWDQSRYRHRFAPERPVGICRWRPPEAETQPRRRQEEAERLLCQTVPQGRISSQVSFHPNRSASTVVCDTERAMSSGWCDHLPWFAVARLPLKGKLLRESFRRTAVHSQTRVKILCSCEGFSPGKLQSFLLCRLDLNELKATRQAQHEPSHNFHISKSILNLHIVESVHHPHRAVIRVSANFVGC